MQLWQIPGRDETARKGDPSSSIATVNSTLSEVHLPVSLDLHHACVSSTLASSSTAHGKHAWRHKAVLHAPSSCHVAFPEMHMPWRDTDWKVPTQLCACAYLNDDHQQHVICGSADTSSDSSAATHKMSCYHYNCFSNTAE